MAKRDFVLQFKGESATIVLMGSNGEICPGYKVDVGMYYAKLVPFTLVAALLGFGAALEWLRDFGKGETASWRAGWGIAAIAVGGAVCALTSCALAVFPGC